MAAGLPILETGPVAERLRVREIDDDEGRRLVRIVRRGGGSVVTWRRAISSIFLPLSLIDGTSRFVTGARCCS